MRLVIVLVSRIQKSGTGNNKFVKWKGAFQSELLKWWDRSKWTTFKAVPEYSGQTKPNWYIPFDVPTEISRILGWMEVPFIEMYMCMIIINNTKFNDYEIANKICVLLFYFVVLGNWTRRCFGSQVYRVVMEES